MLIIFVVIVVGVAILSTDGWGCTLSISTTAYQPHTKYCKGDDHISKTLLKQCLQTHEYFAIYLLRHLLLVGTGTCN